MKKTIVITTIQGTTPALEALREKGDWEMVVVGDRKTPQVSEGGNCVFLPFAGQEELGYALADVLPVDHYSRKNLGYLHAISHGAEVIYDTDDDNIPYPHWGFPPFWCRNQLCGSDSFVNVYRYFTDRYIWPRGFPLDEVQASFRGEPGVAGLEEDVAIGAWSGVVDGDPDVDAVYRLIVGGEVKFWRRDPVFLPFSRWCPFNSQNTFWQREAFAALYLPVTVNFRFTDILRGYVAQRLFQEEFLHLGFMEPVAYQERNPHNLMHDFEDEGPCYLQTRRLVSILEEMTLEGGGMTSNLVRIYERLREEGMVGEVEVVAAQAWAWDVARFLGEPVAAETVTAGRGVMSFNTKN